MTTSPLGRILRSLTAAAVLFAVLPATARADLTGGNGQYQVSADEFGWFDVMTATFHPAGSAERLVHGGFDLVHSYSTNTDYPLAYGGAQLTRIDGGLRQTIDPGGSDALLVEQDSVVTGSTATDSLVRFTLRLRNVGSTPIRLGARSTMDVTLDDDDDPRFTAEDGAPLSSRQRFESPAFRTFTLEDQGEAGPRLRARWTVAATDVGGTAPDLLDVAACCHGGYGPLMPEPLTESTVRPDSEVSWIWGADASRARTIEPGAEIEFTVAVVATRGDTVTTASTAPAIEGAPRQGAMLTGDRGDWNSNALTTFELQWLRCDGAGADCDAIPGADSTTYAPAAADVGHRLRLRETPDDGAVAQSAPTAVIAPPDTTAPVISAPVSVFLSPIGGATRSNTQTPIRTSWGATDASGICAYTVSVSRDRAAYTRVSLAKSTSVSVTQTLELGVRHRYRATAIDCAGNRTVNTYGDEFIPMLHDAVAFTGGWTTQTNAAAFFGGTQRYAKGAGSRVSFTATAKRLAFVSRVSDLSGQARVFIDGALATTIDLRQPAVANRMVVYQRSWTTAAPHTITVENVATPGRPRIDADAFGVFG